MEKRKEPRYRIVVKYENGVTKTIDKNDEGRPLTEDTWEAEYEYWRNEQTLQYETNIECVRVYKGNRRIA